MAGKFLTTCSRQLSGLRRPPRLAQAKSCGLNSWQTTRLIRRAWKHNILFIGGMETPIDHLVCILSVGVGAGGHIRQMLCCWFYVSKGQFERTDHKEISLVECFHEGTREADGGRSEQGIQTATSG